MSCLQDLNSLAEIGIAVVLGRNVFTKIGEKAGDKDLSRGIEAMDDFRSFMGDSPKWASRPVSRLERVFKAADRQNQAAKFLGKPVIFAHAMGHFCFLVWAAIEPNRPIATWAILCMALTIPSVISFTWIFHRFVTARILFAIWVERLFIRVVLGAPMQKKITDIPIDPTQANGK